MVLFTSGPFNSFRSRAVDHLFVSRAIKECMAVMEMANQSSNLVMRLAPTEEAEPVALFDLETVNASDWAGKRS